MNVWNPRPVFGDDRQAYFAGYSDGWYGYMYGSGQEPPRPPSYHKGFMDGHRDNGPDREIVHVDII